MKFLRYMILFLLLLISIFSCGCLQDTSSSRVASPQPPENTIPVSVTPVPVTPGQETLSPASSLDNPIPTDGITSEDSSILLVPPKDRLKQSQPERSVYLTFDDGPSVITPGFLDVLKENGVHATFCVIGNRAEVYPEIIKRAYEEGNAIINHSFNHNVYEVYENSQTVLASIDECNKVLDLIIQRSPIEKSFVRLPGGSSTPFTKSNRDTLIPLLKSGGYITLDWNISSSDCATGYATADYIEQNAIRGIGIDEVVILMHDFKYRATTLQALPAIIKSYKDNGYAFKTVKDMTTKEIDKLKLKKVINMMY